jgi:hypothetical protein
MALLLRNLTKSNTIGFARYATIISLNRDISYTVFDYFFYLFFFFNSNQGDIPKWLTFSGVVV